MIGAAKFLAARRLQLVGWVLVGMFAWLIAAFYDPRLGFTSLLSVGDHLEPSTVTRFKQVPHYIYDGSYGYDGAYYVQLALHPTLTEPELKKSIDNLPYRAKRMLMYWTAWIVGLGHDAWVVNAFALLNVVAWFALAALLLRWFPLNSWDNLIRWGGLLFSHGVCMSVRNSLADLPSLLLLALAVAWLERGKRAGGIAAFAAAALTRETTVIASAVFLEPARAPERPPLTGMRRWLRFAGAVALAGLPLAAWSLYVRWRVGPMDEADLNNFAWPLVGLAQKWGTAVAEFIRYGTHRPYVASVLTVAALTVQGFYLLVRWQPRELWWRVGVSFAGLMLLVSEPVWEGYPGAASRVLLPLTLAFNVLVPRGARWLPLLLLGNLSVFVGPQELQAPPEFFSVRGPHALTAQLAVTRGKGWYAAETFNDLRWRWCSGEGVLKLNNTSGRPLSVILRSYVTSSGDERRLRVTSGEELLWGEMISAKTDAIRFGRVLPPGETVLTFKSDKPPLLVDTDPRPMAFKLMNLEIVVSPPTGQR